MKKRWLIKIVNRLERDITIVKLYIESELDKQKSLLDAVNGKKSRLASILEGNDESKPQILPSFEYTLHENKGKSKNTSKSVVDLWKDMRAEVFAQATGNKHAPNDSDDTTPMFSLNDIDEIVEMLSNPKPEVKFEIKPDSWYVCKKEVCLWLKDEVNFISFKEDVPYLGTDILKCNLSFEPEYHQKYFRLWTICDVKPGDVLAIGWKDKHGHDWQKIVIFKSLTEFSVEGYGNTFKNNELAFEDESVPHLSNTWTKNLHPATKEQRDLLFQKMKESGYEWDSDKKELHKILEVKTCAKKRGENEAVTKIEPKFKINDVMRTLEEANDDITEGLPVVISIDDDYYHCNNETIAIKDQDEYEYPPMNAKQKEIKTRRMTNQELDEVQNSKYILDYNKFISDPTRQIESKKLETKRIDYDKN